MEQVKAGSAALLHACQAQLVCLTPEDLSDTQDCRSGLDTKDTALCECFLTIISTWPRKSLCASSQTYCMLHHYLEGGDLYP